MLLLLNVKFEYIIIILIILIYVAMYLKISMFYLNNHTFQNKYLGKSMFLQFIFLYILYLIPVDGNSYGIKEICQ